MDQKPFWSTHTRMRLGYSILYGTLVTQILIILMVLLWDGFRETYTINTNVTSVIVLLVFGIYIIKSSDNDEEEIKDDTRLP